MATIFAHNLHTVPAVGATPRPGVWVVRYCNQSYIVQHAPMEQPGQLLASVFTPQWRHIGTTVIGAGNYNEDAVRLALDTEQVHCQRRSYWHHGGGQPA